VEGTGRDLLQGSILAFTFRESIKYIRHFSRFRGKDLCPRPLNPEAGSLQLNRHVPYQSRGMQCVIYLTTLSQHLRPYSVEYANDKWERMRKETAVA
jgi:hypothetical protein